MLSGGQNELKTVDLEFILTGMDGIAKEAYMGKCEGPG